MNIFRLDGGLRTASVIFFYFELLPTWGSWIVFVINLCDIMSTYVQDASETILCFSHA